ncbi:MAG: MoaD/ThiS family protein [Bacteroidota bacterium]
MEIEIMAFGIARDIFGASALKVQAVENSTVKQLLEDLKNQYPKLQELRSVAIAINTEYADLEQVIKPGDEVVIIPPVAGG